MGVWKEGRVGELTCCIRLNGRHIQGSGAANG